MKHKKQPSAHTRKRSFFDFRGGDLADANEQELQKEGFSDAHASTRFDPLKKSKKNEKKGQTSTDEAQLPIQANEALPRASEPTHLPNEIHPATENKNDPDFCPYTDELGFEQVNDSIRSPSALRPILIFTLLLSLLILSVALCLGSTLLFNDNASLTPPAQSQQDPPKNEALTPNEEIDVLKPSEKEEEALSASELYQRSIDSVVSILTENQTASGIGSGFLISDDGYIATASHVIENMTRLTVRLSDGRDFTAKKIANNELTDLAVLKIDADSLPFLTFGKSEKLMTGDRVFAIGTPASIDYAGSLSSGEISYQKRTVKIPDEVNGSYKKTMTLIQTSAPVNPGNSGCPLFNEYGEVIGIITMKLGNQFDGIGFAIPSDGAVPILLAMVKNEPLSDELLWAVSAPSARLGILGQTESENGYTGVRILDFDGDPLPHAATVLQKGDLILRIDTQAIKTTTELRQALQEKKPKQSVSVTVLRLGQELTFDVMLEK